jgi:hypothetical protein
MKLYFTLILLLFSISSLYGENDIIPNAIDFSSRNCGIKKTGANPAAAGQKNQKQDVRYISNPIKHFLDYHDHLNKNHEVMFFEVDVNNDKKADLFVSSDSHHLFNAQQGRIFFVYLTTKNNKYYWEDDNNITLRYNKLIFNNIGHYQDMAPLILLEEDSIWACSYNKNKKNEYELLDIKWSKHPHAADIFHDILEKSHAENHPLIVLENNKAISYWEKHVNSK